MDRVLALLAGSRGFDSHRGHMYERFFRSNRPGYPHSVSSELKKKVVSERRSVIAVSLNVGGGVRLIKPAKLYMFTQNSTNTTRTHGAGCVRQWFCTAEPLGELELEHTHSLMKSGAPGLVDRVFAVHAGRQNPSLISSRMNISYWPSNGGLWVHCA